MGSNVSHLPKNWSSNIRSQSRCRKNSSESSRKHGIGLPKHIFPDTILRVSISVSKLKRYRSRRIFFRGSCMGNMEEDRWGKTEHTESCEDFGVVKNLECRWWWIENWFETQNWLELESAALEVWTATWARGPKTKFYPLLGIFSPRGSERFDHYIVISCRPLFSWMCSCRAIVSRWQASPLISLHGDVR